MASSNLWRRLPPVLSMAFLAAVLAGTAHGARIQLAQTDRPAGCTTPTRIGGSCSGSPSSTRSDNPELLKKPKTSSGPSNYGGPRTDSSTTGSSDSALDYSHRSLARSECNDDGYWHVVTYDINNLNAWVVIDDRPTSQPCGHAAAVTPSPAGAGPSPPISAEPVGAPFTMAAPAADITHPPVPAGPDSYTLESGGAEIVLDIPPPPPVSFGRTGASPPPAGEQRFVPGQIVVELPVATPPQALSALEHRYRMSPLDGFPSKLTGTTWVLLRDDGTTDVATEVGALAADPQILSAQPNYLFDLQQAQPTGRAEPALQYAAVKLRLTQAHQLARGDHVVVGILDSAVDVAHPELRGVAVTTFDAVGSSGRPHGHGTAIAALIAAHARLLGAAPSARIVAAEAFAGDGPVARGTTFAVLKGLDWLAANDARVINMSFAGPPDPALHRTLASAYRRNIVLVAAAGNAGPYSAPLYPAADPYVLAVTASDAEDHIFAASNRGRYIRMAAPGVDLLVAAPDNGYEISSGTSFSAAEVSGVAALLIEEKPGLGPEGVRAALVRTARSLPAAQPGFNPGLVDAYRAIQTVASTH